LLFDATAGRSWLSSKLPLFMFGRMRSERLSVEASQTDASTSRTPETMATPIGSARIWHGRDGLVFTFLGSADFPSPGCAAACTLYWDAWRLGGRCRLGLRQMVARLCARLQAEKRSPSGRGHRLAGPAALCTSVCNSPCLDPAGHRTLGHRQPHFPSARRQRVRNMVPCGAHRRGNWLGAVPPNFARQRKSVGLGA
jgi:hypothetical protein